MSFNNVPRNSSNFVQFYIIVSSQLLHSDISAETVVQMIPELTVTISVIDIVVSNAR